MRVLLEAEELIHGERNEAYGDAEAQFTRIAAMWSAITGADLDAEDVALCMTALKLIRASDRLHPDDLLDAAGYIGLTGQIRGYEDTCRYPKRRDVTGVDPATGTTVWGYIEDGMLTVEGVRAADHRDSEIGSPSKKDAVAEAFVEDFTSGFGLHRKAPSPEAVGGEADSCPRCGCPLSPVTAGCTNMDCPKPR